MYLYLGQTTIVWDRDVVGVFDLDNTSVSRDTRGFLAASEKRGQVEDVSGELPKSFVLTESAGRSRVYLSQLAAATLFKRAE